MAFLRLFKITDTKEEKTKVVDLKRPATSKSFPVSNLENFSLKPKQQIYLTLLLSIVQRKSFKIECFKGKKKF